MIKSTRVDFFVAIAKKSCDDMLNTIKDIDNSKNISNKFKSGIINLAIETIKSSNNCDIKKHIKSALYNST